MGLTGAWAAPSARSAFAAARARAGTTAPGSRGGRHPTDVRAGRCSMSRPVLRASSLVVVARTVTVGDVT
eukprot:4438887-Alexandrium_andersonii.AAC.1